MRPEFRDPRLYVPHWFKSKQKLMRPNGLVDGGTAHLFNSLWLDYEEAYSVESERTDKFDPATGKKVKFPKIPEKNMEKAWREFLVLEHQRVRELALQGLDYNGTDDSELRKWLLAVTGADDDFHTAVLKHVLWQVKRKIRNRKVVFHLCPMFFGEQNGGKSTAVFELVSPLKDFTLDFSPVQATDERNAKTLADNYICVFDEMAGMGRVEVEAFKRVITAECSTYRPLHTNAFEKVPQNTTFFGISNKALQENIYDTTGLRRFVEFKCLDKLNWSLLQTVDYMKVWHSINENLERGYVEPVMEQLTAHQQSLLTEDEVGHFVREMAVKVPADGQFREIPAKLLYDAYSLWRAQAGYNSRPALPVNQFGMRLSTHRLTRKIKRADGKDVTVYYINQDSHVFSETAIKGGNLAFLEVPGAKVQ